MVKADFPRPSGFIRRFPSGIEPFFPLIPGQVCL
jgi:hypothetical protein